MLVAAATLALLVSCCSAMVDDCQITHMGAVHLVPDNVHCGDGDNILHDKVCSAGECVDRFRVQHFRWKNDKHIEYIVCRQPGVAATASDTLSIFVECDTVNTEDGAWQAEGKRLTTSFSVHLAEGDCWQPHEEDMFLEKPSAADELPEMIMCRGRVMTAETAASAEGEVDTCMTAFSYEYSNYMRYY